MKDFIYQINENECGFACLKMLLAMSYKDYKYLFLPHKIKNNHQYSLFELKDIAKEYGLILEGYMHKNVDEIKKERTPFILVNKNSDGGKHAIIIKKVFKFYSLVYDPSIGKKLISNKKLFSNILEGTEVLIIESFTKKNVELNVPDLIDKKHAIFLGAIECLSIISFFISAKYISPECYMTLPIIFIVAGVLLSILYRVYSYNIMMKFDDYFIQYTYDNDYIIRKKKYTLMHKTKSGIFSNTYRFLLNLLSALAVNTILILNNNYLFYILVTSSLIVIIDYFFINPAIKKEEIELENLEYNLLLSKTIEKEAYESAYKTIKDKTYKIARQIELKKVISYFILLMVTFFVSGMRNEANVYFILFNFTLCLFTYTSLLEALRCIENYKENTINKTKFYDLIINSK